MKIRHKKLIASGIALSLAGVLGAGALLQTSVSVQASYAMMPGIEQIVKDTSEEKPFKILEIVDNTSEAEIGYYVSGQEPYVKLYEYKYIGSDGKEQTKHFQSLEEGLSQISDPVERKEFAMNVNLDEDDTQTTNIKQIQNVCYQSGGEGQASDYPLSYSEYREKYFLTQEEKTTGSWENDWKKIDFTDSTGKSKSHKVEVKGNYQENTAGTGDYTKKEQQYYPIRKGTEDEQNQNEKVRENIQNFYYTGSGEANSPYFLTFEPVSNDELNNNFNDNGEKVANNGILADYNSADGKYGYYENVYEDLTEEIVQNLTAGIFKFPGENPSVDLNGAKKLLDTSVNNGTAFSSGEDEFMSVDDTADQTQTTQQDPVPEVPQAEEGDADAAFSDGDFTSGADVAETEDSFDSTGTDADPQESAEADNNVSADANTVSEATTDTGSAEDSSDNVKSNPLIPYVSNQNEQGTKVDPTSDSYNPLVYYGETIDQYPFYKYTMISNLKAVKKQAETNTAAIQDGTFDLSLNAVSLEDGSNRKCNVTLEDGQYWFWIWKNGNVDEAVKYPVSIVTCRQPVAYNDVHKIPTGIGNYYYKVSEVYFCCKKDETAAAEEDTHAYQYYGWYSPSYADESNPYIHEDDPNQATYYVSDAEYELTPGTGNYDFVPDDNAPEQNVEVDHMYYQGGYTNHDWFKQYVFHLEPGEAGSDERKQFDAFKIEVTTITTREFNEQYGGAEKTASATFGDSEVTETTNNGDSTDSDHSSADDSVISDDTQAGNSQTDDIQSDDGQTDNTSDVQDTDTQDTNEAQTEDQAAAQNEGDTSEVEPMVSEAGVELVSIEKEISDSSNPEATSDSSVTTDFQDGSDTEEQNATAPAATDTSLTEGDNAQISSDGSDEEEFTDSSAAQAAFSAGDTDTAETLSPLAEYGLIYVNGNINATGFQKIYNSAKIDESIPCIINSDKLLKLGDSSTLKQAVINVEKTNDTDGHYVNTCVYFFKNTLNGQPENLINTSFHQKLNLTDADITDGSDPLEGFEEISNYIKLENKYRGIGETENNDLNENPEKENTEKLLSEDISQARAIEYIINYKYKRKINTKTNIKVLEIEPFACSAQIDQSKVLDWLDGNLIENVTACCWHNNEEPGNATDNNKNKIWHSAYKWGNDNFEQCYFNDPVTEQSSKNDKEDHAESQRQSKHWIEFSLKTATDITGFKYQSRQDDNNTNGTLVKYSVCLTNESGTQTTITGSAGDVNNKNLREIKFNETVQGVKKIRLTFDETKENRYASCAEFEVIEAEDSDKKDSRKVTVNTMTAAEFVGHIDDIASEYDLIYIGDGNKNGNPDTNHGNTLLTGPDGKLYSHVGDIVSIESGLSTNENNSELSKLLGQLDNEYDQSWSGDTNYKKRFAPVSDYKVDGAGYLRGSGNDMTRQECEELVNFVKSGYPVVLGNALVNDQGKVNENKVDASSYYYEFIEKALNYPNVITRSEADQEGKLNSFYVDLAKPVIKFAENGGRPPEPTRLNETEQSGQGAIQNQKLEYTFTIENDSDSAPATSTYDCKLYFDLNFDGNLSEKEVQDKYMSITDSKGKVLSQAAYGTDDLRYQLKIGEQYTVTRKIPADYYKLITWKLVITNNDNTYIHTSETGYSKQDLPTGAQKQKINVLQIMPDNGGKWNLEQDAKKIIEKDGKKIKGVLNQALNDIQDFEIQIKSDTVSQYVQTDGCSTKEDYLNYLKKYQILIIGFDDVYPDISNDKGQVDAIREYIKSGRSVIFSHDTTSYLSYSYGTVKGQKSSGTRVSDVYPKIAETTYNTENENSFYSVFYDKYLSAQDRYGNYNPNFRYNPSWGISLNSVLRSIVGMDRYGITLTDKTVSDNLSISTLLKQGGELNSSNSDFSTLLKNAGDIAYKNGDKTRTSSYAQTQAFTNALLRKINQGGEAEVTTATKLNDGAITQYPYRIGAKQDGTVSDSITIAKTHGQYYQLALEKDIDINGNSDGKTDIVVWYCLSGDKGDVYSASPNDARNCYYYYSNGNVIYTGTGHSSLNENTDKDEIYLFVNSIVAAANVTAVNPYVDFVKELNPSAQTEKTRYYATDQAEWTNGNVVDNDMDFYINIKDYNMVSASLSEEDQKNEDMIVNFYIGESEDNKVPVNSNINTAGGMTPYGDGKSNIHCSNDGFHLGRTSNNAYKIKLTNMEDFLRSSSGNGYTQNCKLFVEVTSKVTLYGEVKENTSIASINLKQRQLFDLD